MRLLSRSNGVLSLTPDREPTEAYAILSHTWGSDEEEVTLDDIRGNVYSTKAGYHKIDFCLNQAQQDGYKYVWVDTCCIDKRDRNELGEAINLMFDWYAHAAVCYVYLTDVAEGKISENRWFTRGWTLPELVAPRVVRFYSDHGTFLGDRSTLQQEILEATQIDTTVNLAEVSLPERFRWSLTRQTTKPEDASYCLLGLLEIKLLFNYGEGAEDAQERLIRRVEEEHGLRIGRVIRSIAAQGPQMAIKTTYQPTMTIQRLLSSLEFEAMYSRRGAIKDPFRETCKWILVHESYQPWSNMQSEKRFLWIKGHPGTGKSTLMRFLDKESDHAIANVRISFYFNARGNILEKTTQGMYRSLLRQILVHYHSLQSLLTRHINDEGIEWQPWTIHSLQNSLKFCIKHISGAVQCFIDALDECNISDVQEMVYFLEDLAHDHSNLFVCFASRHYPEISIRHATELLLDTEKSHNQDLQDYVDGRLDVDQSEQGKALKLRVVARANGIFFWAVLVVELLNKELRAGSVYNVQQRLEDLPSELSELLRQIIGRDEVELPRFRLCLQWILFSGRPLKVREYYLAMITSLSEIGLSNATAYTEPWESVRPTLDQLSKFVSSSSRGLAEVVSGGSTFSSTVQFIHESVRDFLLKHNGLQNLHTHVDGDLPSWVHENLRNACERYLATNFMVRTKFVKEPQLWRTLRSSDLSSILPLHESYLFLDYSLNFVVYHADQAAVSRGQERFLNHFDVDLFKDINQVAHPPGISSLLKPSMVQFEMMHILSFFDAARLIRAADARFDVDDSTHGISPLSVAIRHNNENAARELLNCGAYLGAATSHGRSPLLMAVSQGHAAMCQLLIEHGANVNRFDPNGLRPLQQAVDRNDATICQILLKNGAEVNETDVMGRTPLQMALHDGNDTICHTLLEHGAAFNMINKKTIQELFWTNVNQNNTSICHLLLQNGAEVDAINETGQTALHEALRDGNDDMCLFLLKNGAEFDKIDHEIVQALFRGAVDSRNKAICQILLDNGAEADATLDSGRTALQMALSEFDDSFCQMLLQKGAKVDRIDHEDNRAPLHIAVSRGDIALCKMLLDFDADMNIIYIEGPSRRTPLHLAVNLTNTEICEILLQRGAEVNTNDEKDGWTPLHQAASRRSSSICRMLLDCGAKPNTTDDLGRSVLHIAITRNDMRICKMLLEHGADPNMAVNSGQTPLHMAISYRDSTLCKMLLENGADATAVDENGKSLLQNTIESPKWDLAEASCLELLLRHGAKAEIPDVDGETAFYAALDNLEAFKILLQQNPDTDATHSCLKSLGLLTDSGKGTRVNSQITRLGEKEIDQTIYIVLKNHIKRNSKASTRSTNDQPRLVNRSERFSLGRIFGRTLPKSSQ